MAISLNKGGNLSLSKTDPNLTKLLIGLGWDERATSGQDFDLDASAFVLNASGKVRGDHLCCGIDHTGTPCSRNFRHEAVFSEVTREIAAKPSRVIQGKEIEPPPELCEPRPGI